ncbi:hypothetical protein AALP_AA5G053300 [Arabis alpina]|uniref:Uncharacterized protein n=1 Tax=Arabis alpina TaxID=50452 RepID=A0A087GV36_ARAAL|nr:hypothetical protein AALP_AA5G053300 [Arabis alpina]
MGSWSRFAGGLCLVVACVILLRFLNNLCWFDASSLWFWS